MTDVMIGLLTVVVAGMSLGMWYVNDSLSEIVRMLHALAKNGVTVEQKKDGGKE